MFYIRLFKDNMVVKVFNNKLLTHRLTKDRMRYSFNLTETDVI